MSRRKAGWEAGGRQEVGRRGRLKGLTEGKQEWWVLEVGSKDEQEGRREGYAGGVCKSVGRRGNQEGKQNGRQ